MSFLWHKAFRAMDSRFSVNRLYSCKRFLITERLKLTVHRTLLNRRLNALVFANLLSTVG